MLDGSAACMRLSLWGGTSKVDDGGAQDICTTDSEGFCVLLFKRQLLRDEAVVAAAQQQHR